MSFILKLTVLILIFFYIFYSENYTINFQALHHQFVASALAVKLGHEINPDFQIGCMIAYMCGYPSTCNPMYILKAQQHDQMKNMLCGDVQVRGYYP